MPTSKRSLVFRTTQSLISVVATQSYFNIFFVHFICDASDMHSGSQIKLAEARGIHQLSIPKVRASFMYSQVVKVQHTDQDS